MFEPLIDPRLPISSCERREIVSAAREAFVGRTWWFLAVMVAPFVLPMPASIAVGVAVTRYVPEVGPAGAFHAVIAMYAVGFASALCIAHDRGYAPLVRTELNRRGHRVCVRCGYTLEGLPDQSHKTPCPECGG